VRNVKGEINGDILQLMMAMMEHDGIPSSIKLITNGKATTTILNFIGERILAGIDGVQYHLMLM
jgi:hypothetical protein